jgi:hypothetical protein
MLQQNAIYPQEPDIMNAIRGQNNAWNAEEKYRRSHCFESYPLFDPLSNAYK